MRRWIGRAFWLAAWSFWLWLGFGLYRELPRDLGPFVRHFVDEPGGCRFAVVGGGRYAATWSLPSSTPTSSLRVRDAPTGVVVRELALAPDQADGVALGGDWIVVNAPTQPADDPRLVARIAYDVVRGTETTFRAPPGEVLVHPKRPWAAFYSLRNEDRPGALAVVDLRSGSIVFEWDRARALKLRVEFAGPPCFLGDDRIVVSRRREWNPNEARVHTDDALEVWPIGPGVEVTVPGVIFAYGMSATPAGLVAGSVGDRDRWAAEVWEVNAQRLVFREEPGARGPAPVLSADGRVLYSRGSRRVFEMASGRCIWAAGPAEFDVAVDGENRFETIEVWRMGAGAWTMEFPTFVVRDLYTGRVLERTWQPTLKWRLSDSGGRSFVCDRGNLYELPPRVSFPLLAFCQTILALPLVLLWAILRWRRKRRLRSASVTP